MEIASLEWAALVGTSARVVARGSIGLSATSHHAAPSLDMTKAELIERIARSRDLPPDVTKKCIAEILDIAFDELSTYFVKARITRSQTPRFTMPGFGTFTKKKRASRKGVNPQTLEPMVIEGFETVDFKPGTELKASLKGETKSAASKTTKAKPKSRTTKAATKSKTTKTRRKTAKTPPEARVASGNSAVVTGGRRLRKRDELEFDEMELPEAPMSRVRARRRRGDDVESTG